MFTLYQLLHGFFTSPQPSVTDVQLALQPVHEQDTGGSEFLNDFTRMDDEEESEPQ